MHWIAKYALLKIAKKVWRRHQDKKARWENHRG